MTSTQKANASAAAEGQGYIGPALLSVLLALLVVHVTGVCLDLIASIHYPFGLDYGEGIVWQQAALIPGPHMYPRSQDLPFIVFNYPPLYFLASRAALFIEPDFLAAGRLVSALSTMLIAFLVAALVLIAARLPGRSSSWFDLGSAIAAGLLVLCLHAVRIWGMMMRVDMMAIALSMSGLLLAAWSNGRFFGTLGALLLCLAAMFTKQTQLPAGISVFLIALLRNPRGAICAAAITGAVGIGGIELMQRLTGNGFLLNIIGYNVNRLALRHLYWEFWPESSSFLFMCLMLVAFAALGRATLQSAPRLRSLAALRDAWVPRRTDRATTCRELVLLYFILATPMLSLGVKSGASFNYLLEWLSIGCILIGILLSDLVRRGAGSHLFEAATLFLIVCVAVLPFRSVSSLGSLPRLDIQQGLVNRISSASKPVASEDMVLLMRAGKSVIFEPAIATELAVLGRWNEAPLVQMIRMCGFAFMITTTNEMGGTARRSPAVDAAMRIAYPYTEQVDGLWLHLPAPSNDSPAVSGCLKSRSK